MTTEAVAQAAHELRGALHAAGLALHAGAGPEAVQVELDRAAVVVGDLDRTPAAGVRLCDVAELMRCMSAAWKVQAAASQRELVVHCAPAPLHVTAEPGRVAQVLGNLVANALEHGGGRIEVAAWSMPGEGVVLAVADQGNGLPATVEVLAAAPRGRRGRGLAIVSGVVDRLGGRLAAEGSRVVVELPAPSA